MNDFAIKIGMKKAPPPPKPYSPWEKGAWKKWNDAAPYPALTPDAAPYPALPPPTQPWYKRWHNKTSPPPPPPIPKYIPYIDGDYTPPVYNHHTSRVKTTDASTSIKKPSLRGTGAAKPSLRGTGAAKPSALRAVYGLDAL